VTTPTLKPALPGGSIRTQNVDEDFAAYIAGRPVTQRIVLAVVQVSAVHASTQEAGRKNKASYETVHAVEVTDPHEIDQLRHRLTQLRADRGLLATQPALFDTTEDEQRESLLSLIKDWASETDTPMVDVDTRWLEYYGGSEHADSETVQASRSLVHLREFAYVIGAIADDPAGETPPVPFSDEPDPDET
jgi:hypothetical protein